MSTRRNMRGSQKHAGNQELLLKKKFSNENMWCEKTWNNVRLLAARIDWAGEERTFWNDGHVRHRERGLGYTDVCVYH